jgi:hypothetical protein
MYGGHATLPAAAISSASGDSVVSVTPAAAAASCTAAQRTERTIVA